MGVPNIFITAEEYLKNERKATQKHEYYKGEVFAMGGASITHNIICTNCSTELRNKLKGKNCRPFANDLRIHIPKNTLYTYPDISVICGEIDTIDDLFDTATNPTVIIEILSSSTRKYDLIEKFSLYREIESLKNYILIDSEATAVIKYTKNDNNTWLLTDYKGINDSFLIESINVELNLTDIYEDVVFK
jgi:Uma2 family endonuclease